MDPVKRTNAISQATLPQTERPTGTFDRIRVEMEGSFSRIIAHLHEIQNRLLHRNSPTQVSLTEKAQPISTKTPEETEARRLEIRAQLREQLAQQQAGDNMVFDETALTSFFAAREILIVDDLDWNLKMLARFLSKFHIQACAATSGDQAHRMASEKRFFAVVMDYDMPNMNGDRVVGLIRRIPGYEKVPIIGYTSAADNEAVRNAFLKAGADDVVKKGGSSNGQYLLLQSIQKAAQKSLSFVFRF